MGFADGMGAAEVAHISLLIDKSGSMRGTRINQVNLAMPRIIDELKKNAAKMNIDVQLRVIAFNNNIEYVMGTRDKGEDIKSAIWRNDLVAAGTTNTAAAIDEIANILTPKVLGYKALPPVIILISDGYSDENKKDDMTKAVKNVCGKLKSKASDDAVIRVGVGIGDNYNRKELEDFSTVGTLNGAPNTPFVIEINDDKAIAAVMSNLVLQSLVSSSSSGSKMQSDGSVIELSTTGTGSVVDFISSLSSFTSFGSNSSGNNGGSGSDSFIF